MRHNIQCIIGSNKVISELADNWIRARKVELNAGFSMIPLTKDLIEDMNELANCGEYLAHEEFKALSKSVESVLKEFSYKYEIGYIETEYFGDTRAQSAISYSKGTIFEGPKITRTSWDEKNFKFTNDPSGERAINSILLGLGLEKRNDVDSFNNLGLGNFQSK